MPIAAPWSFDNTGHIYNATRVIVNGEFNAEACKCFPPLTCTSLMAPQLLHIRLYIFRRVFLLATSTPFNLLQDCIRPFLRAILCLIDGDHCSHDM